MYYYIPNMRQMLSATHLPQTRRICISRAATPRGDPSDGNPHSVRQNWIDWEGGTEEKCIKQGWHLGCPQTSTRCPLHWWREYTASYHLWPMAPSYGGTGGALEDPSTQGGPPQPREGWEGHWRRSTCPHLRLTARQQGKEIWDFLRRDIERLPSPTRSCPLPVHLQIKHQGCYGSPATRANEAKYWNKMTGSEWRTWGVFYMTSTRVLPCADLTVSGWPLPAAPVLEQRRSLLSDGCTSTQMYYKQGLAQGLSHIKGSRDNGVQVHRRKCYFLLSKGKLVVQ